MQIRLGLLKSHLAYRKSVQLNHLLYIFYDQMNSMSITDAFDDNNEFRQLLRRIQIPVVNVNRLMDQEGIDTARVLAGIRVKDLELFMTNVNRLFGSQTTVARRIYFAPCSLFKTLS